MASLVRIGFRALPRPARAALILIAIQVALGTAFRIVFWLSFRSTAREVAPEDWLRAWYLGLKFDVRLALWICLPFLLLALVPFLNPVRSRFAQRLWQVYFVSLQAVLILAYFVDLGHYDYLHTRMDSGLFDLVSSPAIALAMVWETYPVLWGLLTLVALTTGYGLMIRRTGFRTVENAEAAPNRWHTRLAVAVFTITFALGIYGKWSWYPLRWSDAYFGTDPFVSSLALNPILFFVDSFPERHAAYDEQEVRKHYGELTSLLGVELPDPEHLSFERLVIPSTSLAGQPNLVVVHLESFAAYKTGAYGNQLSATPGFDAIAEDALLFTNFFVPSGPTARAIFTMVTGIPDLNPVRSASRNPRAVSQHTILNALEGYDKLYFLGGSATWGNIRGLMTHNIEKLEVYEEGSYRASRGDVWGISDLHLFEAAHEALRRRQRPFFAFIQTAGNHRPDTIPQDRRGFEVLEVDGEKLKANGFENLDAFNSLRFLDHSLRRFFELAREEPYFSNTVFALYGDHGGPAPRPTPWDSLGLTINHVPGVIYSPGFLPEGRRIETVASLVDLLPTCLSLIGVAYVNTTLGRDLLADRAPKRRFALLSDGLITDDFLLRVDPRGASRLYQYRAREASLDVAGRFPAERNRLLRLYDSLDNAARYLLYNNPPLTDGLASGLQTQAEAD